MSDLFWLTDARMAHLERDYLHQSQWLAVARLPSAYGPHKTLYTRWKRWSDKGIFARVMAGLAAEHGETKTVMIPFRDITS